MAVLKTIYRDAGKPDQAVPVTTECVLTGARSNPGSEADRLRSLPKSGETESRVGIADEATAQRVIGEMAALGFKFFFGVRPRGHRGRKSSSEVHEMDTNNEHNGNGRIELLKKREAEIRAAIAVETVKRKKREFKEFERLKNIVGGALLANAAEDPVFAAHLKERLQKAVVVEGEQKLLRSKGWL